MNWFCQFQILTERISVFRQECNDVEVHSFDAYELGTMRRLTTQTLSTRFLGSVLFLFLVRLNLHNRQTASLPISDRLDRASATKGVNSSLISSQVKTKTVKIDIYSFVA